MNGMEATEEQKEEWSAMDDEDEMIRQVVKALPMPARKSFEHFALQLQLVVSTATRVRHALEEGVEEEVARCVDAGAQIADLRNLRESWKTCTESRLVRLSKCQMEAEHAQQQLAAISSQLSDFGGQQSGKSKGVLMSMAANQDKNLIHTVFSTWAGWLLKRKSEAHIHDKFKKQIQEAEDALINFKKKQLDNVKGVLGRSAAGGDQKLLEEVVKIWYRYIIVEGHTKEMEAQVKAAQDRFNNAKGASKENTKKVMSRMAAGQDASLVTLCWQAWQGAMEEMRQDRMLDDQVK